MGKTVFFQFSARIRIRTSQQSSASFLYTYRVAALPTVTPLAEMGSRLIDGSDSWRAVPSAHLFTEEQLAELRECFVLFDKTGGGFIEGNDLGRALRALGQNPSEEDVAKMLSDAKLDASGRLSASEYLKVIGRFGLKKEEDMNEELVEAFRVFDRNDSGSVRAEELRNALKTYGESLEDDDIEQIMKLAGTNENGSVDYLEFASKLIAK